MSFNDHKIETGKTKFIAWSSARLPKEGEKICGDLSLVKKSNGKVLVAAVDGLGHGVSAAKASKKAIDLLESFEKESLINLIHRCHKELRQTRGVVMSLALIDSKENMMTWIGVGNVEGVLFRAHSEVGQKLERIVLRGGVIGYKLPSLQAAMIPIFKDDIVVFTTDGVEHDYVDELNASEHPEEIVEFVASNYFKKSDDALIIAGKYLGEGFQYEN
ncbi:MAG: SpoIIE family protein phosphatase [Gracilimonas sp.]|uniref:SpoIIE family protein phosphatase n=1 Tax=Gracilimonas sp. TaxID=1974203 RepID=UPI0019CEA73B|nr:SpoIIE family protein phosphatase [Gracilimonas sp.]MBD3615406.1 SpoIIE family protein phosphatase [Gracilimonas sp.]